MGITRVEMAHIILVVAATSVVSINADIEANLAKAADQGAELLLSSRCI